MKALLVKSKLFYLLALAFWSVLFLMVVLLPKGTPSLYINSFHNIPCDYFFYALTCLGDGLFAALLLMGLFMFWSKRKALAMTVCFLSVVFVVQVLKNFFFNTAPRPHTFFENIPGIYYVPWIEMHGYNSFPSGHTAQAFCLALCLVLYTRNNLFGGLLFMLAVLTGFSRIYLMQHFPVDVLGGSLIAVIMTTIVFYIVEYKVPVLQRSTLDAPLIRIKKQ
jgi:membrane-associated phospholipid phosphatase